MKKSLSLILFLIFTGFGVFSQENLMVVFYNVENLFDTINDPQTNDEEYTPDGKRHWDTYRYQQKLKNIYKVLANAGGVSGADIIGICEIENHQVLSDLAQNTPLVKHNYQIIHYESPDRRGIDVGLLVKNKTIKVLHSEALPVKFPFDISRTTRDILYAKLLTAKNDTLHVFVNHWPSRYGGEEASKPNRKQAAIVLKQTTDSLLNSNTNAKIIIIGDFNDTPFDPSLLNTLQADTALQHINPGKLYNLAAGLKNEGSHKYYGKWSALDQVIVSSYLLTSTSGVHTSTQSFKVFKAPFMLEKDTRYTGHYPLRTYRGLKWQNGYSDHLPVVLKLAYY